MVAAKYIFWLVAFMNVYLLENAWEEADRIANSITIANYVYKKFSLYNRLALLQSVPQASTARPLMLTKLDTRIYRDMCQAIDANDKEGVEFCSYILQRAEEVIPQQPAPVVANLTPVVTRRQPAQG